MSNFTDSTGRTLPAYRITRDGFTLLTRGFTGKEAQRWKLPTLTPLTTWRPHYTSLRTRRRMELAFSLPAEAATQVHHTVFNASLSLESWPMFAS